MPRKIGGWLKLPPTSAFLGTCRALHDWVALDGTTFMAVGTHKKLYLWQDGSKYDITPLAASGNLANPFTTTIGLYTVEVAHAGHGRQVGDYVRFSGASAVGGITISGEYTVTSLNGANAYFITHTIAATSSAGPGGGAAVAYEYDISVGSDSSSTVSGWGTSTWSSGMWGVGTASSGFYSRIRIWSLQNWGEDLIASPRDGRMYLWDKTGGTSTRATLINNSPTTTVRMLVSAEDRHVLSLGSHDGSTTDRLLIRWCESEDYNTWTSTPTNSAGDIRLDSGSEILTGIRTRGETLVFTDVGAHSLQFVGAPFFYAVRQLGESSSVISPNVVVDVNGIVYWMGQSDFFVYDGSLRTLPCDIWSEVFDNINRQQRDKCFAARNQQFQEVWFFYPSDGASEVDRVAIYNYAEGHWTKGALARTAFHDSSPVLGLPYGISTDGRLVKHESGVNDDTSAMTGVYIESHDMEIGEGQNFAHVSKAIPDFESLIGSVDLYLKVKRYPSDSSYTTKGPFTVDSTTSKVSLRARGRQVALRVEAEAVSDDFIMGDWRLDIIDHGER
jgi:hypothetical protein